MNFFICDSQAQNSNKFDSSDIFQTDKGKRHLCKTKIIKEGVYNVEVVVVERTHAGASAVKSVSTSHPETEVTVYERSDSISLLPHGATLYVGDVVKNAVGLFYSNPEKLASLRAIAKIEHSAEEINMDDKAVTTKNLQTDTTEIVSCDKLVMTIGSWPIVPPIPGIDAENILLYKNYSQANATVEKVKGTRCAVVAGGGYIGVGLVKAFIESGKQITLVDGLDRILNKYSDKPSTDILEKKLIDRDVNLVLGGDVQQFVADEQEKVAGVITSSQEFETDVVTTYVSFRPNTELLKDRVDMLPDGAIEVSGYIQTGNPDIFVAGDNAVVYHDLGQTKNYVLLTTGAVRQGMLVDHNLTKQKLAYHDTQGISDLYLFGWKIGLTDVTKESTELNGLDVEATVSEDNYRSGFIPTTRKVLTELVYEEGAQHTVDGQLISKYGITQSADTLSLAVRNKMTAGDLAISDFFFQPHLDHPRNYLSLLTQTALENM